MTTESEPLYTKEEWKEIEKNGAYCPALFTSLYLNPQSRMSSCCVMDENNNGNLPFIPVKDENGEEPKLSDLLNQDYFKKVRKDALQGIKNPACTHCWKQQENFPDKEYRRGFITKSREFKTSDEIRRSIREDMSVDFSIVKLEHMDVRFSTLCNLRCRSCSGAFSSSWYKEEVEFYKLHHNPVPREVWSKPENFEHGQPFLPGNHSLSVESLKPHLPCIKRIYFAGGEPTMMKEHYEILQFLIDNDRTDVMLTYNINFSQLTSGKYDVIEYWKKFPNIQIGASLDGSHEKAEYIRKGLVWSEVEKNIIRLRKECPHVGFYLSPTTGIMNAYNIVDFHKEWVRKGYINVDEFMINILYGPEYYNVKNLPLHHKEKLTVLYDEHIKWIDETRKGTNFSEEFGEGDYAGTYPSDGRGHTTWGNSAVDFENLKNVMNNTPQNPEWDRLYWKHFWLDESRKEDFFEIFPEYEDLRYIKGLGCKSFHGVQETWVDIYMDHLIRLSRGLDRYREPPEEIEIGS